MLRALEAVFGAPLQVWESDGPGRLPVGADTGLWLEAPPGVDPGRVAELFSLYVRADRQNAQLAGELSARFQEIDLLYTISEVLGHTVRLRESAEIIVRAVSGVVGARRASIAVYNPERESLRTVAAQGFDARQAPEVPLDDPESIAARVVREGKPLLGLGTRKGYRGSAYMSIPILWQPPGGKPRTVGVINLTDRVEEGGFTPTDQKLVSAAANQIGAAIELTRLVAKEKEQQRLHDELQLAHDLQLSLLPNPALLQGDARVAVRCLQAEQVGGDFYTFNRLGLGLVGVMVGDVASHGFAAALLMAAVMSAAGIHASGAETPDHTLKALRQSLAEKLASADSYLTVFYGIIDPVNQRLTWASAGHPHAFRFRKDGRPERLDATAPPLGLAEGGEIGVLSLPWSRSGDLLCLWTDGLVDAVNDEGEQYGEERLLAAIGARRTEEPERIVEAVMAEANAFAPHPVDDRTLLVLRL